jgi:hypothetical protein
MIDDLKPGLSYPERLLLLRERERSWRLFLPRHFAQFKVPFRHNGLYDFLGGVLILGHITSRAFSYIRMPSLADKTSSSWQTITSQDEMIDFGVSVHEHDLIAVLTM